jgi:hypothetical protein
MQNAADIPLGPPCNITDFTIRQAFFNSEEQNLSLKCRQLLDTLKDDL